MAADFFAVVSFEPKPHQHFLGGALVVWPGRGPLSVNVYRSAGILYCGPAGVISTDRFNLAELESAIQIMLRVRLAEFCPQLCALLAGEAGR